MIEAIVGLPGAGKTLHATKTIKKSLNEGRQIYTNVHVNDDRDYIYYENFMLLIYARNGLLILDEAQVYMNSRKWQLFPPEFQFFLQRHRHNGLDLLALTQDLARTDKVFRELVQKLWLVDRKFFLFKHGLYILHEITEATSEYIPTGKTRLHTIFPDDLEYYNTLAYKTQEFLPILDICKVCGKKHFLTGWTDENGNIQKIPTNTVAPAE